MPKPSSTPWFKAGFLARKFAAWPVVLGLLLAARGGSCGEAPSLTEYQVKALCLLNFAKYVDWPPEAYPQADAPLTIGVLGESHFGRDFEQAAAGKSINGRKIVIRELSGGEDWGKCRILFVSASEKKRLAEIISKVKSLPVLTVGETEQFTEKGGVINFMKKEGKIRFEIGLDAAREAKLTISSKLLNLADTVKGKIP